MKFGRWVCSILDAAAPVWLAEAYVPWGRLDLRFIFRLTATRKNKDRLRLSLQQVARAILVCTLKPGKTGAKTGDRPRFSGVSMYKTWLTRSEIADHQIDCSFDFQPVFHAEAAD